MRFQSPPRIDSPDSSLIGSFDRPCRARSRKALTQAGLARIALRTRFFDDALGVRSDRMFVPAVLLLPVLPESFDSTATTHSQAISLPPGDLSQIPDLKRLPPPPRLAPPAGRTLLCSGDASGGPSRSGARLARVEACQPSLKPLSQQQTQIVLIGALTPICMTYGCLSTLLTILPRC
jgi:hypothetical protein